MMTSSPFTHHNTGCWHALFHASLPPVTFTAGYILSADQSPQRVWIAVARRLMLHFPPSFIHPAITPMRRHFFAQGHSRAQSRRIRLHS